MLSSWRKAVTSSLHRCFAWVGLLVLPSLLVSSTASGTSSSVSSKSPFGGNGHNVTFDGRVYVVRQTQGWTLTVLRPQNITYQAGGKVVLGEAFSAPKLIQPPDNGENAMALCEPSADTTPYPCNEAGQSGGPFHCYDLVVFDSNAEANQYNGLRRRTLKIWISDLFGKNATLHKHTWGGDGLVPLKQANGTDMRGIEPTVTRDGRLLVWQGRDKNNGDIDRLVYAVNDSPCATTGWTKPKDISEMHTDPKVVGTWALGEKQLRAADGTPFPPGQDVRGGYPWLFHDGDALIFTATKLPCISQDNPPGCGPRRSALSVIGYPTNWAIGHIDGDLNPSTTDQVRLFFSSPGPFAFEQIPVTGGIDIWPFFGSNTANYAEVVFDDSLDGQYAGVWHMNEVVDLYGNFNKGKTPDTGGYFNTGTLHNASFPNANNGLFGKGIVFNGKNTWISVADDASLNPVNGLTVEMWLKPEQKVDCDGNNNYRVLLSKGDVFNGTYSLVFEENELFQARFRAGGEARSIVSLPSIPVGEWSQIGFTYNAQTGLAQFVTNGVVTKTEQFPPAPIDGMPGTLTIGGPGGSKASCPNGHGVFNGIIDEVRISRVARDLTAWGRPGNHARFISQNIPATVVESESFDISVTMRNIGTTAWSPAKLHRLGSQSPQDNNTWGTGRIEIGKVVGPGEEVTITSTVKAPKTLGAQPMQWRMVQEGAEWFGEFATAVSINVIENPVKALCHNTGGNWAQGACQCPDGMGFDGTMGCQPLPVSPEEALCEATQGVWSNGGCDCPQGTSWSDAEGCEEDEEPPVAEFDESDATSGDTFEDAFMPEPEDVGIGPSPSPDAAPSGDGHGTTDTVSDDDVALSQGDSTPGAPGYDAEGDANRRSPNNPTTTPSEGAGSGCQSSSTGRSAAPTAMALVGLFWVMGRLRRRRFDDA